MNKQELRLEIIRKRIEDGFYFQRAIYEIIAQKVLLEWKREGAN